MKIEIFGEISHSLAALVAEKVTKLAEGEEVELVIDSPGGDVAAGWRIYDTLRQLEGHPIKARVVGVCASMATIVLVAAEKSAREAFPNSTYCVHNPELCWLNIDIPARLTSDALDNLAEDVKKHAAELLAEQQKMVATLSERTGYDLEKMQALMDEDKMITADAALAVGLISNILPPKSASKQNKMSKFSKIAALAAQLVAVLKMSAMVLTTVDGEELRVEREEGDIQVGDVVTSPDGVYVLTDGRTVTVEGGVITNIAPKEGDPDPNEQNKEVEELRKEVEELKKQLDEAKSANAKNAAAVALVERAGGCEALSAILATMSKPAPGVQKPTPRNQVEEDDAYFAKLQEERRAKFEEQRKKMV